LFILAALLSGCVNDPPTLQATIVRDTPTPINTPTRYPTETLYPTRTPTVQVTPTITATATVTFTFNIRVANVPIYRQLQTLTCEEAAAAMATRGKVTEAQLLAVMPRSDNPFLGIRGQTDAPAFGGIDDYGVYAQGLQKGLSKLGITSEVLYKQPYEEFKNTLLAHMRAGRPIIWWHTWRESYQKPVVVKTKDGSQVKLVPYEHAGVLVAANDWGLTYHDPYDGSVRTVSWADHHRVSGYFDNMALVIK
jgi:uncharacterized protein YvpB